MIAADARLDGLLRIASLSTIWPTGDGTPAPALAQQFREDIGAVSSEDFDQTLKTNLYALHRIAQAAGPHLPPGASVITTASVQAYEPSDILLD